MRIYQYTPFSQNHMPCHLHVSPSATGFKDGDEAAGGYLIFSRVWTIIYALEFDSSGLFNRESCDMQL
jgi:hypothetical protein